MALDVSGVASGQVIQAAHITQFNSLLTGVMTDQAVTLKNQLSVGGNQGIGAVPLTIQGVSEQTADYLDITAFGGGAGGVFKITSTGALTFGFGVTVSTGGLVVSAGGLTVTNGGLTVTAGGLTVTAGGLTVTAGGLQITAGNVGIGTAAVSYVGLLLGGTVTATAAMNAASGVNVSGGTLMAHANSDALYGIFVNPTFNDGGFTGVTHYTAWFQAGQDINLGGTTAMATTATIGFPYLPSCAGTPTGVPNNATVGRPIVIDSTGVKLWVYVNGAWKGVALT